MKMFEAWFADSLVIKSVECQRATDTHVWTPNPDKPGEFEEDQRVTSWYSYHETWEEAHDALVEAAGRMVEKAEAKVDAARSSLAQVRAMTEEVPQMNSEEVAEKFGGVDELVFWSFRYFVGRQTIQTSYFAQSLADAWPSLNARTREMITKELEEEFARDDLARGANHKALPLGVDCDRAAWEKVRGAYAKMA